jgi:uncharacterized protein
MAYHTKTILLLAAFLLPLTGCSRSPHQRLNWKAEDFFTDRGVISLCKAIEKKDIAGIDRLVKSGVNINAKGRGNMTPLLWAFPMGEEVFEKMLVLGADPNVNSTGALWPAHLYEGTSVMSACATPSLVEGAMHGEYFHDVPMDNYLKLVLKHGGDPNCQDANGETPIFYLGGNNVPEILRLLRDAGADLNHRNSRGETPLIDAVGKPACAMHLLKVGADYRLVDDDGWDFVILLQRTKDARESDLQKYPNNALSTSQLPAMKPVFAWLADEGVDWKAARKALDSPETMRNLKNIPADYKHRPWLPQRPTLKKLDPKDKGLQSNGMQGKK